MRAYRLPIGIVLAVMTAFVTTAATSGRFQSGERPDPQAPLVVHEWGTFTSVAGKSGEAVDWQPLGGPSDLPCFVRRSAFQPKSELRGTVRMETPVLYFYSPRETTVDVNVSFRQGLITEWFPRGLVTPGGPYTSIPSDSRFESAIKWNNVRVLPGAREVFPVEPGESHYYTARHTDAVPVQRGDEREKFLFYRGVGRMSAPLSATVEPDGTTTVWNPDLMAVGDLILFQNRGGALDYQVLKSDQSKVTFNALTPDEESSRPLADLERMLVAHGLYPKEAAAMIETWRDSWFEEGTRLIYIVSPSRVQSMLPLQVTPAPTETVRVFVGRLELVTPVVMADVVDAYQRGDRPSLQRHWRFLEAIANRIGEERGLAGAQVQQGIRSAYYASWTSFTPAACK